MKPPDTRLREPTPGLNTIGGIMAKITNTSKSVVKAQVTLQPGDEVDVPDHVAYDLGTQTSELTGDIPDEPVEVESEDLPSLTKDELYELATERDIEGRSSMSKKELIKALESQG